jgi:hypothetical protein
MRSIHADKRQGLAAPSRTTASPPKNYGALRHGTVIAPAIDSAITYRCISCWSVQNSKR